VTPLSQPGVHLSWPEVRMLVDLGRRGFDTLRPETMNRVQRAQMADLLTRLGMAYTAQLEAAARSGTAEAARRAVRGSGRMIGRDTGDDRVVLSEESGWASTDELAEALGVTDRWVRARCAAGSFVGAHLVASRWRIPREYLERARSDAR
jgi:hypothetical protein